jgi:hypothetical protein
VRPCAVGEGHPLGGAFIEQIDDEELLPGRARIAIDAELPAVFGMFRIELVDVRQGLAGLLDDRLDRLLLEPPLGSPVSVPTASIRVPFGTGVPSFSARRRRRG